MTYRVHLTLKSGNKKTGPIPVSTTSAETCPDACSLKGSGCYADGGPLGIHWREVTEGRRGVDWDSFCDAIAALPRGQLWRHNQAGELPGNKLRIDIFALAQLVAANDGRRGFTYTHYSPSNAYNRHYLWSSMVRGFTVNLSADNLEHADRLAEYDCGPVVTLLPADAASNQTLRTPRGRKVVVCPATYRDDVSCASCGLCRRADRDCIVGFPVHGTAKRKAQAVFTRNGMSA